MQQNQRLFRNNNIHNNVGKIETRHSSFSKTRIPHAVINVIMIFAGFSEAKSIV